MRKICFLLVLFVMSSLVFAQKVDVSTESITVDGKTYIVHTVKKGQTLYGISKAYGVSIDEIVATNPGTENGVKAGSSLRIPAKSNGNEAVATEDTTHSIGGIEHVVEKGETVYGICRKYNLSVKALYDANPGIQEAGLKPGDVLIIPESDLISEPVTISIGDESEPGYSWHEVKRGETLYSISKKYDVAESDILNCNDNLEPSRLKAGQKIKIPRTVNPLTEFPGNSEKQVSETVNDTVPAVQVNEVVYAEPKSEIEVFLLMPFDTYVNTRNWYNQESSKKEMTVLPLNEMMLAYYSGCMMALDSLKNSGLKINLHVYDTGNDTTVLSSLIENGSLHKADFLIGPVYSKQISYLKNKIPKHAIMISPFADYEKADAGNNPIFWANPGRIGRNETIAAYAAQHADYKYIIVYNNTEASTENAKALRNLIIEKSSKANQGKAAEVSLIAYSDAGISALTALMSPDNPNIVIATEKTEAQASGLMAKLVQIKKIEVQLIGELSWLEFKSVDATYYQRLKFTYVTPYCIDYSRENVKQFVRSYRDVFYTEPMEHSFAGFDQVSFFLSAYAKHGFRFPEFIEKQEPSKGLVTQHQFIGISGSVQYIQMFCYLMAVDENYETVRIFPE